MTKAAQAKSWTLHEWADGTTRSYPEPEVGDSALEQAVAALSAGQSAAFAGLSSFPLSAGQIEWQARFFYDALNGLCHCLGKAANDNNSWAHAIYSLASNSWSSKEMTGISGSGHIYDNASLDPATGDVYLVAGVGDENLYRYTRSTDSWGSVHSNLFSGAFNSPVNGVVWHPDLFGDGDGGVIVCTETDGNNAGFVFWRKSTGDVTQDDTAINTGNGEGMGVYFPGIGKALMGGSAQTGQTTANNHVLITPGTPPTVVSVGAPPIATAGTSYASGGVFGTVHVHPGDTDRLLLLERRGDQRVWESSDGDSWTLKGYTHPFDENYLTFCELIGLGAFWAIGDSVSLLWKPDD